MYQAYVKGTDTKIVGTLDLVPGICGISHFYENNLKALQWAGETKMCWDDQQTVKRNGLKVYVGENGLEYTEDLLEMRPEED